MVEILHLETASNIRPIRHGKCWTMTVTKMTQAGAKVILISGRTLMQGRTMEVGKLTDDYRNAVAVCEIDATVIESLGIHAGDPIEVKTSYGKVVVTSKKSKGSDPTIAFIPCGPYYNALVNSYTQESGMPGYKSLEATISPAGSKKVTELAELFKPKGGA